jgi:CHAD domain-containing protein
VRAFEGVVETADQATLHQLRIAAKWLRYTLEFMREPLEPEAMSLIRSVIALQDALGDIHDQQAAAWLARSFLESSESTAREAASIVRFIERLDRNVDQVGRSLGTTWRLVVAPSFRRRLGRAIARL